MDRYRPAPDPAQRAAIAEADALLLADARRGDPGAIDRLVTRYDRRMAGVAYAVLQHRDGTQVAVARGIAEVWRRIATAPPDRPAELEAQLLGAAVRQALAAREGEREVDALGTSVSSLTRLSPEARGVAALHVLSGLSPSRVAAELGVSPERARSLLAEATGVHGSLANLRTELERQAEGLPVTVSGDDVREAIAHPPARRRRRRLLPMGLGLLAVGWAGLVLLAPPPATPGVSPGRSQPAAERSAPSQPPGPSPAVAVLLPAVSMPDLSLRACEIEPASTPLSFAGWLTLGQLGAASPSLAATQPVYAIITDGMAEWLGWRTTARAMYPRVVGRLGCYVDPGSGSARVVAVSGSWRAPEPVDGCLATPGDALAGIRELDARRAAILPTTGGTEAAPGRLAVHLLARLAPDTDAASRLTAWAQPLGPGSPIKLSVARDVGAGYVWLDGGVSSPGCWVITLAVDGHVVAGSILMIPMEGATVALAAPRTLGDDGLIGAAGGSSTD